MGLQISELVPKKQISFKDLENKKIAIDASQMLYQFLSSIRQQDGTPLMDSKQRITSHLQGIITRVTNLMAQNVKLYFIFDGKAPLLKVKEQEEREYRKQIAEERFKEAKEEQNEELMLRYSKQSIRVNNEMIQESKELIQALGLPVIQAPSEAEAQCAFMGEKGDVDYVGSTDYDCLLYGAPKLVKNLTVSQRRKIASGAYINVSPEVIELKEVLKNLGIKQDQLIILAILIGTDYHEGVPRIGPKTALKLVRQYKNYDKLFKEVKADFNWKQIYATFKNMPVIKNYKLRYEKPDVEKIMKLLVDRHEFNQERVQKNIDRIINVKKTSEQNNLTKYF
ncbi:MAG: flap endonuclease-1 [Nanoarchaeota archaeon]